MTLEHRKSDILTQLFLQNTEQMAANLAKAFDERDTARARVAELEKELADTKALLVPPAPAVAAE